MPSPTSRRRPGPRPSAWRRPAWPPWRLEPIHWLVPGYFPLGKLILLAGDGGHGKSSLTLAPGSRLDRGLSCLGLGYKPLLPADVLLIQCEDDYADTVVPRLLAAGADRKRVYRVDGVRGPDGKVLPFSLAYYEAMERELEARPNIRLVVIDPAGAYIGRSGVDEHKDSELAACWTRWRSWRRVGG